MPIRIMGYDAAEYSQQINRKKRQKNKKQTDESNGADEHLKENEVGKTDVKRRYPVVSLILYFGYEHPWNAPLKLHELLDIPEGLEDWVSDYRINIVEIAWLDREVIDHFRSDFRIVADYFWQKRVNKEYIPTSAEIRHVKETLSMLSIMSGDHRFEAVMNEENSERTVPRNMEEVIDRYINRGIEEGIISGRTEDIRNLMDTLKLTVDQAMDALKIPEADRAALKAAL